MSDDLEPCTLAVAAFFGPNDNPEDAARACLRASPLLRDAMEMLRRYHIRNADAKFCQCQICLDADELLARYARLTAPATEEGR